MNQPCHLILGVESSCDETAAAVLQDGKTLLSNVIDSQITTHAPYGGVVPELASRKHIENIFPVVQEALHIAGITLEDLDGISVTTGPGLIGSLLVGLSFVKALSYALDIPYVGVDHISGHLSAIFLDENPPSFPYIALIASGGHSTIFEVKNHGDYTLMGRSRDDAAGEAFDKVAKILSLPYPGGPVIGELAKEGDPQAIPFPRAWLGNDNLDFSFSGLKTSVANYVHKQKQRSEEVSTADICASFQEAVVEVLVEKTITAAKIAGIQTIVLGGGVAANSRLRAHMLNRATDEGLQTFIPPSQFCTDNAAMIALAGFHQFSSATKSYELDVYSRSQFLS